jgi:hypothetical protein
MFEHELLEQAEEAQIQAGWWISVEISQQLRFYRFSHLASIAICHQTPSGDAGKSQGPAD